MTPADTRRTAENTPADERQLSLDAFASPEQCLAIAVDTGERCEHSPVPGARYCHQHLDLDAFAETV